MTEALDKILTGSGISSSTSRQLFINKSTFHTQQKLAHIFVEGKQNRSEYVLVSGIAHRYNISSKGGVATTGFYMAGTVITPHFARTKNNRSLYSLQVLTDAVVAEIPVDVLNQLRAENKELYDFGNNVVEKELSLSMLQELHFRSFDAKERLLAMRQQYPNLENLVPHHIIASYLGITHVSFSRLRKELSGR
ncbi:Crp/Fnr family transcriptional regulator [Flavisolibacter sp. BT320]|nr:Crp/Fnr family transcriptional regulator [Flavisolibacter longurius]